MKDIRQAIIPLTGDTPDLLSASFAVPRVMLPVFTRDGRCIPFVQLLVEECVQAGIDRILLVTTPRNDLAVRRHFDVKTPKPVSQKARADKTLSGELKNLVKLCHHIEITEQPEPEGDAQAVFAVQNWIDSDRFLIYPSRAVVRSHARSTCLQQFLALCPAQHHGALALYPRKWGLGHDILWAVGSPLSDRSNHLTITQLLRNSGGENLRAELGPPLHNGDHFPVLLGPCVVTRRLFDIIATMVEEDIDDSGLFLLTEALRIWSEVDGLLGILIDGERLSILDPINYLKAASADSRRNAPIKNVP